MNNNMMLNQPTAWQDEFDRIHQQLRAGVNGDQLENIGPQLCYEPLAPVVSKLTYPMYAQKTDAQQQTFNDPTSMWPGEEDFSHGWRHQPQLHIAPAFAMNVEPVAQEEAQNNWMLQGQGFEGVSAFPAQAAWSDSWQYLPSRDPIPNFHWIPSPPTNTSPKKVVQLKKCRGRPRKYPPKDPNAPKRSGGRPKGAKIATRVLPKARRPS